VQENETNEHLRNAKEGLQKEEGGIKGGLRREGAKKTTEGGGREVEVKDAGGIKDKPPSKTGAKRSGGNRGTQERTRKGKSVT